MNIDQDSEGGVAAIIKTWNGKVARASQLVGARAVSVKNVLTVMPSQVRDYMMDNISREGWDNCCLSEDILQSKKVYPRFVFRASSKEWTTRGKVTPESMLLTARYIVGKFDRTPKNMRRKPDRKQWEDISHAASVFWLWLMSSEMMFPLQKSRSNRS